MMYFIENTALKYLLEELPKTLLPELWDRFERECESESIKSDRETKKLLEKELSSDEALLWLEQYKFIFTPISEKAARELGIMMGNSLFDYYEKRPNFLNRKLPEGVPFVIAMAKAQNGKFVCRKAGKDGKLIINICNEVGVKCIDVEEFLFAFKEESV
jgi:hypothetical protein